MHGVQRDSWLSRDSQVGADVATIPSIAELVAATKREFAGGLGANESSFAVGTFAPESAKGGFVLTVASEDPRLRVRIQYLDMQLEVTISGEQAFGDTVHPGFAGNMFSREHLLEALPRLASVIRQALERA